MKAAILTFHRAYNYGAVLQCYALTQALAQSGIPCEVIDYWPDIFRRIYLKRAPLALRRSALRTLAERIVLRGTLKRRNAAFGAFLRQHLPLSDRTYRRPADLRRLPDAYGLYITGSDQVWNSQCTDFDPVFFLDFPAARARPRFAYAASFGIRPILARMHRAYGARLRGYAAYTVREASGVALVRALTGREASVVCDPVLLLTADDWHALAGPPPADPYILLYYVAHSADLQAYAQRLSANTGYRVVCVVGNTGAAALLGRRDRAYPCQIINDCGPEAFISLLCHAAYVVTDSFHGTALSIVLQKPFVTRTVNPAGYHDLRIAGLLDGLGIAGRSLSEGDVDISAPLPWADIQRRVDAQRQAGYAYLRTMAAAADA